MTVPCHFVIRTTEAQLIEPHREPACVVFRRTEEVVGQLMQGRHDGRFGELDHSSFELSWDIAVAVTEPHQGRRVVVDLTDHLYERGQRLQMLGICLVPP